MRGFGLRRKRQSAPTTRSAIRTAVTAEKVISRHLDRAWNGDLVPQIVERVQARDRQNQGDPECGPPLDLDAASVHEGGDAVERDVVAPIEAVLQQLSRPDGERPAALQGAEGQDA